jgi:hypothetical protein
LTGNGRVCGLDRFVQLVFLADRDWIDRKQHSQWHLFQLFCEGRRPPGLILEAQESGLVMKEETHERAAYSPVLGRKVRFKIRSLPGSLL